LSSARETVKPGVPFSTRIIETDCEGRASEDVLAATQ
jgi:hypothetical protein